MSERHHLIPFHGDEIDAFWDETTNEIRVGITRICSNIGLDAKSQHRKLKHDSLFSPHLGMVIMTMPHADQESLTLPLRLLPAWFATMIIGRAKLEVQPKLRLYKEQAADALAERFLGIAPRPGFGTPTVSDEPSWLAKYTDIRTEAILKAVDEKLAEKLTPIAKDAFEGKSHGQKNNADLNEHREETSKKFDKINTEKASQRDVNTLKKKIEAMETVAAGPHPTEGRAQNDVYNFLLDQSYLYGWVGPDGRALEPGRPYINRFKAQMRNCCSQISEGVSHRTAGGGIGYSDQVYWQSDLMEIFESKMGGVEQLRKEINDEDGPSRVRAVRNPKTYAP